MKNTFISIVFFACLSLTGCSFSVNTGSNTANTSPTPASNASPVASKQPAASPSPSAAASKAPESDASSKEADPKSEEEHLRFAAGKTEATIERTIAPGVNKMYLFTAKKDQTISLRVDEKTGELGVSFNKQPVELGVDHTDSLNASGEWAIYVDNPSDKPLKYTLSLGIQ